MFTRQDEQLDVVPTPESFGLLVERLVARYHLRYFDAILELCNHFDREYESVRLLMTPKLKQVLADEMAAARNLKDNSILQDRLL